MARHHFVILSYPVPGHINPNLQFSSRLLRLGARITYITSSYARIANTPPAELPIGFKVVEIHDGYTPNTKQGDEAKEAVSRTKSCSSSALRQVVSAAADEGCPVTCVVYSLLLSWVAAVARELHVPSALICIQPATVFDLYYYYCHGSDDAIGLINVPGLEMNFTMRDLPSFMVPGCPFPAILEEFKEHMAELDAEASPRVLVNTFDGLEPEALKGVSELKLIPIGPLIGSDDFLFRSKRSSSCLEWLDSMPESSVVYVSFGSLTVLPTQQLEEIGRGLLGLGKPFLWVIRESDKKSEKVMSCVEELDQLGMIVPWCDQLQVLSHRAVGCFLTHCGWNSTIEGLANGVPMVGFPQWSDQPTNAKLVEEYWKIGVRVNENADGLVESGEIKRCLELVMGDSGMRRNAGKWKKLAVEAVEEGGSSDKNLRDFVNDVAGFDSV